MINSDSRHHGNYSQVELAVLFVQFVDYSNTDDSAEYGDGESEWRICATWPELLFLFGLVHENTGG